MSSRYLTRSLRSSKELVPSSLHKELDTNIEEFILFTLPWSQAQMQEGVENWGEGAVGRVFLCLQ